MAGRTPAASSQESTSEREAIAERYLTAWNAHDADAVAGFFTHDAVYDDRGAGEVARGRDAIRAHIATVLQAFPDLQFELIRIAHGADFTCAEWACRMTHLGELSGLAPTGHAVTSAGVDVATLDADGGIVHLVSHYDGAAIMRALGVLPRRRSRAERFLVRAASVVGRLRGRVRD